ncbi:MAG: YfhO family protein, partial [Oscillospiraceae bacterium]
KYVVSTYATENKNWELNGNISESNIYSNKDLESAGVLYSSWIDTNKFEELSLLERQAMLSQTVLIEGNVPGAVETGNVQPPRKNQEAIDMKSLKTANGTIVENDHFNFRIEAQEDGSASMTFSLNAKAVNEEYQQNWLVLDAKSMQNCSLQILCDTGFGFDATYWAQTTKPLYDKRKHEIVFKLPNDVKALQFILTNDTSSDATQTSYAYIENCAIYSSDKSNYTTKGINLKNPDAGGKVFGTVNALENSVLLVPIPMQQGWTVTVDGMNAELLTLNHAFLGVELPMGLHEVEFNYKTPYIGLGAMCSAAGALTLLVFAIFVYKKKLKVK